ncbi:MAG: aldehyde dehydrogenase family protein [Planctomycetes bacterium]|nr:aldehyde dehydrogenase family protein [Planctomycetota bacterium]
MDLSRYPFLTELGVATASSQQPLLGAHAGEWFGRGAELASRAPATGQRIGLVRAASVEDCHRAIQQAVISFKSWRAVPAPQRGELVRRIGAALRKQKARLGRLVSLESGKILSEGEGEVQEMIDMADFATGLSRQLHGLTLASERPFHRMYEQWHPLGPVGVLTAFNFPVAVWAWNALIAAVCGDTVVWKPSEKTPLCALAVHRIVHQVTQEMSFPQVFFLTCGGRELGQAMAPDQRLPLISATGSCRMGKELAPLVAQRLGRSLLELGGNNAAIVLNDADLDLTLRAVLFAAAGTAGQRCTTLRRLILEKGIAEAFTARLRRIYASLPARLGDPLEPGTLIGPLIDEKAVEAFEQTVARIRREGGEILCGGGRVSPAALPEPLRGGFFVEPTLVKAHAGMAVVQEEAFAPILYLITANGLDEAIQVQNSASQGLSSSIFTASLRSSEQFLGPAGSDCGIANVNIGTSGAEIGGAFGGEKETGGGREAGSDAWKAYMRRQTCTTNWSRELPLSQGVKFDV